jgi:hypothetical protein
MIIFWHVLKVTFNKLFNNYLLIIWKLQFLFNIFFVEITIVSIIIFLITDCIIYFKRFFLWWNINLKYIWVAIGCTMDHFVLFWHQKTERNISQVKDYATQLVIFYTIIFRSNFSIPIFCFLILIMNQNVDNMVKKI